MPTYALRRKESRMFVLGGRIGGKLPKKLHQSQGKWMIFKIWFFYRFANAFVVQKALDYEEKFY